MPDTTVSRGNCLFEVVLAVQLTPAAVTANTSGAQTFTLPGILTTDYMDVTFQGAQVNSIQVAGSWCSSANVLTIQFMNVSGVAVTPSAGTYNVNVIRPTNATLPANLV